MASKILFVLFCLLAYPVSAVREDEREESTELATDEEDSADVWKCGCKNKWGQIHALAKVVPDVEPITACPVGQHLPAAESHKHCDCDTGTGMLATAGSFVSGTPLNKETTDKMQAAIDKRLATKREEMQSQLEAYVKELENEYGVELNPPTPMPKKIVAAVKGYKHLTNGVTQSSLKWLCCCLSGTAGQCEKNMGMLNVMRHHRTEDSEADTVCDYKTQAEIDAEKAALAKKQAAEAAKAAQENGNPQSS